jgi:hypothetical protein
MICINIVHSQSLGTISGQVIDKISKEPLPGVNIIIVDSPVGAASDLDGYFIIENVVAGTYRLKASYVGYNTIIKSDVVVNTSRPVDVLFELTETVIEIEGVTVTSDYFDEVPTEVNSVKSFSYEEIRRSPGGFEDVVRALSVLPGVAQVESGRNDLIVRGGAPSENLFLVDGLVIPNINHFGTQGATGGPLSFINLDFVRETTFSTGGFSAAYGDKLSSVLSIDLRDGRSDRLGGKATISASQFGINLEGPLGDKNNFFVSVRRSYLDFIFNAAGFNFVPEYYDAIAKATFNLDSHNKLTFLAVAAFDKVNFNNDDEEDVYENSQILGNNQNQYVAGVSYKHIFEKGFYTLSLSRNFVDYEYEQKDTLLNPIYLNNSVEAENQLKFDLVYKLSKESEINVGASAKYINFDAEVLFPEEFVTTFGDTLPVSYLNSKENYTKFAVFAQYSDMFFQRLRLNLGLRADYFNEIADPVYVSPRFSLKYMITDITGISFSTGLYHQFPSYIWLVGYETNKNLNAIKVAQYIFGIEHSLRSDIRMKVEGFYKDYLDYPASDLRHYLVLANTGSGFGGASQNFESFGFEPLLSQGTGFSRGVEFSLQKKSSETPHYGIFSFTYSETQFTPLDNMQRNGSFDQRIILTATAGYIFNQKWEASMKFSYSTGRPYTPYNDDGTQNVADYLTQRFDPFHSLDIRVDRRWDFSGWSMITYIDIQNIYNNKNATTIRWDYYNQEAVTESSIGILPTIGVNVEF